MMKKVGKGIWDHRGALLNGIEMLAPVLLDPKQVTYPDDNIITVEYIGRLEQCIRCLYKLDRSTFQEIELISQVMKLLGKELQFQQ